MADTTDQVLTATNPEEVAAPIAESAPASEVPAATTGDAPAEAVAAADTIISDEQDDKTRRVTLADLSAKGTALYAHKNYEEAAEVFSRASVLQAELNGETAPENAEVLFHYGRSLFKVGQSKSDVLGGSAPTTEKPKKPAAKGKVNGQPKAAKPVEAKTEEEKVTQEGVAIVAADKEGDQSSAGAEGAQTGENKPLFQFTGDENFDDSDDDEEGDEQDQEEEDDDDLATAFEILDLARVCYGKLLEKYQAEEAEGEGKGKEAAEDSPQVRHVKERLADTHDALSEISLENELYPNAIEDGRTSLKYKLELYPEDSEIIAEAHYKLSLALEFASVTTTGETGETSKREAMDQGLRDEAAKQMELAIKSFRLKMQNKEVELATMASPEDNELARRSIAEMKELIGDMEQRLVDLRNDPIDTKGLVGADANPLGGILGAVLGESSAEAQARIDEASKKANDLTGLVRKKKAKPESQAETAPAADAGAAGSTAGAETNGKRKAEDEPTEDEPVKRAKTEDLETAAAAS